MNEARFRIVEYCEGYYRIEVKRKFLWYEWWESTGFSSAYISTLEKYIEDQNFEPRVIKYL
jgi:hypothetical protein